jgi:hypothetical protein
VRTSPWQKEHVARSERHLAAAVQFDDALATQYEMKWKHAWLRGVMADEELAAQQAVDVQGWAQVREFDQFT